MRKVLPFFAVLLLFLFPTGVHAAITYSTQVPADLFETTLTSVSFNFTPVSDGGYIDIPISVYMTDGKNDSIFTRNFTIYGSNDTLITQSVTGFTTGFYNWYAIAGDAATQPVITSTATAPYNTTDSTDLNLTYTWNGTVETCRVTLVADNALPLANVTASINAVCNVTAGNTSATILTLTGYGYGSQEYITLGSNNAPTRLGLSNNSKTSGTQTDYTTLSRWFEVRDLGNESDWIWSDDDGSDRMLLNRDTGNLWVSGDFNATNFFVTTITSVTQTITNAVITMLNVTTVNGGRFFGQFNWTTGDSSYVTFNETHLAFDWSGINTSGAYAKQFVESYSDNWNITHDSWLGNHSGWDDANVEVDAHTNWTYAFDHLRAQDSKINDTYNSWNGNHSDWDDAAVEVDAHANWTYAHNYLLLQDSKINSSALNSPGFYNSTNIEGENPNLLVNWTQNQNYPDYCTGTSVATGINDSIVCTDYESFVPAYFFAYVNRADTRNSSPWSEVWFDGQASTAYGFSHTYNDGTNNTITVSNNGFYELSYTIAFDDSYSSPTSRVIVRVLANGTELAGSSVEGDMNVQNKDVVLSTSLIVNLTAADEIKVEWNATDDTVGLASQSTQASNPSSAKISLERVR